MENDKMTSGKKGPEKKRSVLLILLCVFLAVILAVLVAGTAYVEHMLNKIPRATEEAETLTPEQIESIEKGETEEPDFTGTVIEPEDVTFSTLPPEEIAGNHIVNILLIGQDRRPGEGRARSDAMILCTFNTKEKTLVMTSFLRDLYVQIPGYRDNRMNAAYQLGGMELLNATLEVNFGIKVDGNVEVDFGEFERVVDLLGGVDIELTSSEAGHMNNFGYSLRSGMNHLNGAQALTYARIRKLDSDFGRTNRQRTVLVALIQAYKNQSLSKMLSLLNEILPIVTTDMSNVQIIGYATELFPMLSGCTITTQHIPAEGTYTFASIRGMSVVYPDLEKNREILRQTLMGED